MTEQQEVLAAAKVALDDALGPNHKHTVKVTSTPTQEITPELFHSDSMTAFNPRSDENIPLESFRHKLRPEVLQETKKLTDTFQSRMKQYAKYLSVKASEQICVVLSLHSPSEIAIESLPENDQDIIRKVISNTPSENSTHFYVTFDEIKDFKFIFSSDKKTGDVFHFFNSVIHKPSSSRGDVSVEIENNDVLIAGKKFPTKEKLQRIAGVSTLKDGENEITEPQRRQVVSGKNAYEIRADILAMAIEWSSRTNNMIRSDDSLLILAKKFYQFVENRK